MKEAWSAKELSEALGISVRGLNKQAAKEHWPHKERSNPKGGGIIKEYVNEELPREVRIKAEAGWIEMAVTDMQQDIAPLSEARLLRPYRGQVAAVDPCALVVRRETAALPEVALPEWKEKVALARADLLKLYLDAARRAKGWKIPPTSPLGKGGVVPAKLAFIDIFNDGAYPELLAILGPVTYKTVERWAVAVKKAGDPLALAPRHGDYLRGKRGVSQEQEAILLAWALNPNKHNINEVIRKGRDSMQIRGIQDGQSDATYRRILEDFRDRHRDEWVYSREGKQAWNDQCAYFIRRDYDRLRVGGCLVADGHTFNFHSLNPYTGKPKRLTLITFMDMKSNFPVGWEIMPTENTRAIAAALRRAILTLGKLPLCVYIDNGKAFGAKYFTGDLAQSGISGLFGRLGIETIFTWPYHGQSKTVERWHKTIKEFEKETPTYTGGGIDEKPPHLNRGEKEHRRMWEKLTGGAVPTLMQTHLALAAWLDTKYNPRPQKRGHLKGKCPLEVFEAGRGPGFDPEKLRHLMLSQTVRTIHRRGITFNGPDYYHENLSGRRHPVMIRYDLLEPEAIEVFEEDGAFLCSARTMPEVHPIARITGNDEDRTELKTQIAIKKRQEKKASSICRMMAQTMVQPETERHLARLGLSADGQKAPQAEKPVPLSLTAAEKEQISADAAASSRKMQTEKDRVEEMKARPDCQRYLALLTILARGGELEDEDRMFNYYFRQGEEYAALKEWFEAQDLAMVCQAGVGN